MSPQRWYHSPLALALAAISGVLLAFSLPPNNISILGWIAMLPLLGASLLVKRTLIAAAFGMTASVVCAWVLVGYIATPQELGNMVGAFGSMGLLLAWTAGFACFAAKRCKPNLWPLFVGCTAVTGELLGRYIFPVSLALTQHQTPGALRLASVTGIWGVSFIIWFIPALLLVFALHPKELRKQVLLVPVILLPILLIPFPTGPAGGQRITVAAVQAPSPFDAEEVTLNLPQDVKIAVWPEHTMGMNDPSPNHSALENSVYIVSSHVEKAGPKEKYNTARLASPSGKTIASIRKTHLFGREIAGFKSGYGNHAILCGNAKVGIPICFDTEFTDLCRGLVRSGAQILLVPNNDPEMHNLLFNYLHSAVIPFRAAENGVPIVWAESNGLSTIINASGRRLVQAPGRKITSISSIVTLGPRGTVYLALGDYFAYTSAIIAIAGIMVMLLKRRAKDQELS